MSLRRQRFFRALPMLGILLLPFVLLRIPPVRSAMLALVAYMRVAGPMGVVAFLASEIAATAITTPLWMMSGVAGYVYGFPNGVLVALPGITLASCVCFAIGRALLRRPIEQRAKESRFLAALQRAAVSEGLKITLLVRLTFAMPQNLVSYVLSTTPLGLGTFALGTAVGLVPATLFHVYMGSLVTSAAALLAGEAKAQGPLAWVAGAAGVLMTAGGLYLTSRMAKRALDRALADDGQEAVPVEEAPPVA
ncbi:MAG: VTT domain-containing protein [Byssovorax sp.]